MLISIEGKAKVINGNEKRMAFGPEYDHLCIVVKLDEEYLVDVGFGEFAFFPLKLKTNLAQKDPRDIFIIEYLHEHNYLVSKFREEGNIPLYKFSTKSRELSEFSEMNKFHQENPDSSFTHGRLISLPTKYGRQTLTDNLYKITKNGITICEEIISEQEFELYSSKFLRSNH